MLIEKQFSCGVFKFSHFSNSDFSRFEQMETAAPIASKQKQLQQQKALTFVT